MHNSKKTVLVTGAAAGIGNALAQKLIAEGYFVIGTSRNGKIDNIDSTHLLVIPLELTSANSIAEASQQIQNHGKRPDILINNAGVAPDLDIAIPTIELLKDTFETNVFGLVDFTETMLDFLGNPATIVNISSEMGQMNTAARSNATAYRMSKAALNMYAKTLSARLSGKATVYSVQPGWVDTKLAGKGAPLTPQFSADIIFKLLQRALPTGTFWDAETGTALTW